jgi:hypothetical protein
MAIELAVGRAVRPHGDLDVEVLARDHAALADVLAGWDVVVAANGELSPWRGGVRPDRGSLWCRPSPDAPWGLQVLLADSDGDDWLYRRDHRIRRPIDEARDHYARRVPRRLMLLPQDPLDHAPAIRAIE